MNITIKKLVFLFFIFILSILGDVLWIKNEEQQIVEKAQERTIQYFKKNKT